MDEEPTHLPCVLHVSLCLSGNTDTDTDTEARKAMTPAILPSPQLEKGGFATGSSKTTRKDRTQRSDSVLHRGQKAYGSVSAADTYYLKLI